MKKCCKMELHYTHFRCHFVWQCVEGWGVNLKAKP